MYHGLNHIVFQSLKTGVTAKENSERKTQLLHSFVRRSQYLVKSYPIDVIQAITGIQ